MGQKMQPYYEKMRHKHTSIRPLKVLPNIYNDQSMKSYEDQNKYIKDFKNFTIRHAACYTIGEAESKCDRQNLWTLRNKKSLLSLTDVNLLINRINSDDNKKIHGSDSHLNCVRTIKNKYYNGILKRSSSAGAIF